MPLVQIRRNPRIISDDVIWALNEHLPALAAKVLSCDEGGPLAPKDVMIEVDDIGPMDRNIKDIHIRVWAHDYPTRRGEDLEALRSIRKQIATEVVKHLPEITTWYVWVLLATTSYGSDTMDD